MKQLALTAALGLSMTAFPLASLVLPAIAQEQPVTVTIGATFAETLATAAGVLLEDIPTSLAVSVEDAAAVCGVPVVAGGTCEATGSASTLVPYLTDDSSSVSSSSEASNNSAKEFAPGQLKGDGESAKTYAPGQTKGEGENASDNSPGHQKKASGGDDNGS